MRFLEKKWIFAGMLPTIVLFAMVSSAFCETLNFPEEYSAIEQQIYAFQDTVNAASHENTQNCSDCHLPYTVPHHDYYFPGADPNSPYNPYCPEPPPSPGQGCGACHFVYDEDCNITGSGLLHGEGCGLCHTFDTCPSDDWKFPPGQCFQLGACFQQPEEMIQALIGTVIELSLHKGISNALDAKLDAALSALDDMNSNNDVAAANTLNAFINAVDAQRGNKITNEDADTLIAAAQAIIDKLESQ